MLIGLSRLAFGAALIVLGLISTWFVHRVTPVVIGS
jgi:hypothetical protein